VRGGNLRKFVRIFSPRRKNRTFRSNLFASQKGFSLQSRLHGPLGFAYANPQRNFAKQNFDQPLAPHGLFKFLKQAQLIQSADDKAYPVFRFFICPAARSLASARICAVW
jgi:hypothetical protein